MRSPIGPTKKRSTSGPDCGDGFRRTSMGAWCRYERDIHQPTNPVSLPDNPVETDHAGQSTGAVDKRVIKKFTIKPPIMR